MFSVTTSLGSAILNNVDIFKIHAVGDIAKYM